MPDPALGHRDFTDGARRPVYADGERQYVLDADGGPVHGVWLVPEDEPLIVEHPAAGGEGLSRGRACPST